MRVICVLPGVVGFYFILAAVPPSKRRLRVGDCGSSFFSFGPTQEGRTVGAGDR
jgi:hypothetical protein